MYMKGTANFRKVRKFARLGPNSECENSKKISHK